MNKKILIIPLLLLTGSIFLNIIQYQESRSLIKSNNYTWQDVERFAENCEIASGAQAHSLDVSIKLIDGREFTVKEPGIDAIYSTLWKHTSKCGDVPFATE